MYNYGTTGTTGVTVHPNVGHFDHPTNPSFDLNFGICDYYFYDGISLTNNNVFNLYWRRAVSQINNGKMLTAYFDLSAYDIFKMRLNDKIYINNSWWNINKIIDYDANADALTKVELLSVDDYIDLPQFKVKRFTLDPVGNLSAMKSVQKTNNAWKNINLSSDVEVYGKGNVVDRGLKGIIVGNDNVLNTQEEINNLPAITNNEPKVWKAQIDQTGTSAPTLVELINTLGVAPSGTTYSAVGNYAILGLGSIFTGLIHITVDIYNFAGGDVTASYGILPGDVLLLRSYQGGVLTDGLFNNAGGAIGSSVITITKYD